MIIVVCSLISAEEYFGEAVVKAVEYEEIIMDINGSSVFTFNIEHKMDGGFGNLIHAYRYSTNVEFEDDTILIIKTENIHYSKHLRSSRDEWYEEDRNNRKLRIDLMKPVKFSEIKETNGCFYKLIGREDFIRIYTNKNNKDYLDRIEKVITALNMVYMYEL
jgi:hypothetical protein